MKKNNRGITLITLVITILLLLILIRIIVDFANDGSIIDRTKNTGNKIEQQQDEQQSVVNKIRDQYR